jgi:hypothetical protein
LKSNFENSINLIQDGLNTKSKIFTIKNSNIFVQTYKFHIENDTLRGGRLKCCLFSFVPQNKPLLPEREMEKIITQYLEKLKNHDLDLNCQECQDFIEQKQDELNTSLTGEIGKGIILHKMRDLMTTILGYTQLMHEGVLGSINEDQQESLAFILKYSRELLDLIEKTE